MNGLRWVHEVPWREQDWLCSERGWDLDYLVLWGGRLLCPKGGFQEVLPIFLYDKQNKRAVLAESREEVKLGDLSGCG